jgi:ATP-dependent exoDNAse (exonuclease V) beta subunit
MFFGDINNIALYEQNKDAFVESWFDRQSSEDLDNPNKVDKTYRELYGSKEAFENTINDLYKLAKQYRDLGWALSTDKIVWYSKFASGYVAGETDMIAVDRDGNIHIIDFKTAKGLRPF